MLKFRRKSHPKLLLNIVLVQQLPIGTFNGALNIQEVSMRHHFFSLAACKFMIFTFSRFGPPEVGVTIPWFFPEISCLEAFAFKFAQMKLETVFSEFDLTILFRCCNFSFYPPVHLCRFPLPTSLQHILQSFTTPFCLSYKNNTKTDIL